MSGPTGASQAQGHTEGLGFYTVYTWAGGRRFPKTESRTRGKFGRPDCHAWSFQGDGTLPSGKRGHLEALTATQCLGKTPPATTVEGVPCGS